MQSFLCPNWIVNKEYKATWRLTTQNTKCQHSVLKINVVLMFVTVTHWLEYKKTSLNTLLNEILIKWMNITNKNQLSSAYSWRQSPGEFNEKKKNVKGEISTYSTPCMPYYTNFVKNKLSHSFQAKINHLTVSTLMNRMMLSLCKSYCFSS